LFELDRVEYRKRYADIRKAENRGNLKAFDHFVEHGQGEGRIGFRSLTAMFNILKEVTGVSYVFADYQDLIDKKEETNTESTQVA